MPWSPLGALPPGTRRAVWVLLALAACHLWGRAFVRTLRASPYGAMSYGFVPDFFQDYASARNYLRDEPIYELHKKTLKTYINLDTGGPSDEPLIRINTHPPTSVLLALPFSRLEFRSAFLSWNVASLAALALSLAIVAHELGLPPSIWSLPPLVGLLLSCSPLWNQFREGQLHLVLLLLITLAWKCDRSEHIRLAGCLLGTATAIKLFPGYLFLYYVARRRWEAVAAGILSAALLTALTASLLGIEAYRTYVRTALPEVRCFRALWNNCSLPGFWSKLFDPSAACRRWPATISPLCDSPMLAGAGSTLGVILVSAALVRAARRAGSRSRADRAFGLAVTGMLLVTPVTWDHTLVLLAIPLAVTWLATPRSAPWRGLFLAVVATIWIDPHRLWAHVLVVDGKLATPFQVLTILSFQFYGLACLFGISLMSVDRHVADDHPDG